MLSARSMGNKCRHNWKEDLKGCEHYNYAVRYTTDVIVLYCNITVSAINLNALHSYKGKSITSSVIGLLGFVFSPFF